MALIDIITSDVVKVPLVSKSKSDIINELIEILQKAGRITDIHVVYEAIMNRERKGSTGLENGIAVPHAKTDVVKSLTLSLGVAPQGIDFDAVDGNPSHLFFLLLAPPDQSGPHIEALSEIARVTRSKSFCNILMNAASAEEVVQLFSEE